MAVLSHPPIRASLTRPRLHAILVLDQIRQGRRLLGQLERQAWQAAEDEYYAWHDYNQRLMRLLLSRDEVLEAYLRTTYRPMLVPGSALLDNWGLMHVLFHHSKLVRPRKGGWMWQMVPWWLPDELLPAPFHEEAWASSCEFGTEKSC